MSSGRFDGKPSESKLHHVLVDDSTLSEGLHMYMSLKL